MADDGAGRDANSGRMNTADTPAAPVLEEAAQAFAGATATPPFLFDLPVDEGRRTVDATQDGEFPAPAASTENPTIAGGPTGEVQITIYRPDGAVGVLPVALYTHGAGWVFGDLHTHDRLVRELTSRRSRHRLHQLQPVPGREIPGRDRADLHGPGMDRREWRGA
jgi:hypothetical protein